MAVPEKRDPRVPQSTINDLGDQRTVERSSRGAWRWWWMWPLVIGLVVWWTAFGWGTSGGWLWGRWHTRTAQQMTGQGVQILASKDRRQFIGGHFDVKNAWVQGVNGPTLWIGPAGTNPMLAVVNSSTQASGSNVNRGKRVNLRGTVRKAPPEAVAEHDWSLPGQDANRLEQQGAYIELSQLTAPQH